MLRKRSTVLDELRATSACHEWCYELAVAVKALGMLADGVPNSGSQESAAAQARRPARVSELKVACASWGTRWSRPADAAEAAEWTTEVLGGIGDG